MSGLAQAFTRQLGAESGVQLNPLRDNSEIIVLDNSDQRIGIVGRFTRGRIDKPFLVDRGNVKAKLGPGESMRVSALNEAWVQVVEALNNGAYQAVVQRLATASAVVKWAKLTFTPVGSGAALTATVVDGVITAVAVDQGGSGYTAGASITVGGPGTGAVLAPVIVGGVITDVTVSPGGTGYATAPALTVVAAQSTTFAVSADEPTGSFLLGIKHLECFNDGIKVEIRADEKTTAGTAVANDKITLRIRDSSGALLHEVTGSLDVAAVDDFNQTAYLPDVVAAQGLPFEVVAGDVEAIPALADCYGYDGNGREKWAASGVLVCFEEGGTGYITADYQAACNKLRLSEFDFAYLVSGGTQSTGLLAQLAQLAFDSNRQLRFDVPGDLVPAAAIAFVEQLGFAGQQGAHLLHAFWSPVKLNDPTGLSGKGYFGRASLNAALACGRNAQVNAKGYAPKNFPVAGAEWPINNTGLVQTYQPSDQELSALAKAKINPVLYRLFAGGGRTVFLDSLTSAPVDNSLKKLISVVDMSVHMDRLVVLIANRYLQLPMNEAVKRTIRELTREFENAETSGWLVPSAEPDMGGRGWRLEVMPDQARPYDRMVINYWMRYDGCARQIFVTQTLSR